MAWHNIMESIIGTSLALFSECIAGGDPAKCSEYLLAASDAVYTPLKPIDSGLGEVRRIASLVAGVLANAFILLTIKEKGEEAETFLREIVENLRDRVSEDKSYAPIVLEKAGVTGFEPAASKEARESLFKDILEYVEPPAPPVPRRRRQPRRPDPRQRLRRLLRDLGRRDPIMARTIASLLQASGIERP